MWTFRHKNFLAPGVPIGDPKSPELSPWIQFSLFCSNPLNRVPVTLPHPRNNFGGLNVVLFSIPEADFEAEILSPNDWVGSILISFLHKITHSIW